MRRNGKFPPQRVWIALSDSPDGSTYKAQISFRPSIDGRTKDEPSPSLNVAARLWSLLQMHKEELATELPEMGGQIIQPERFKQ